MTSVGDIEVFPMSAMEPQVRLLHLLLASKPKKKIVYMLKFKKDVEEHAELKNNNQAAAR